MPKITPTHKYSNHSRFEYNPHCAAPATDYDASTAPPRPVGASRESWAAHQEKRNG